MPASFRVRITEQRTLTRVIELDFDDVPDSEVRPRRALPAATRGAERLPTPPRRIGVGR